MQAGAKEDIATLLFGRRWFAARAGEIVEAIDVAGIVPLPFMPRGMVGCLMYHGAPLPVLDLLSFRPPGKSAAVERVASQIVVMTRSNDATFGLLVDGLGEIVEVLSNRLTPLPTMVASQEMFADCALAPNSAEDGDLVVVLRADRLYENLSAPLSHAAAPSAGKLPPGKPADVHRLPIAKSA